jgi:hypothetical protein
LIICLQMGGLESLSVETSCTSGLQPCKYIAAGVKVEKL